MIKRLLNLHTITKIALILTTLLLLPSTAWAKKYTTTGEVKPITGYGSATHDWKIDNSSSKWQITHPRGSEGINPSNQNYLPFKLNKGESMTLTTSKPTSESGNFRKIIIDADELYKNLSTTVTFGSTTLTSNSTGVFAPNSPITWGNDDAITITITNNNTEGEISCTINSITFLTGTLSNKVFSWGELTALNGYDISGITKSENGGNTTLQGHCEAETQFSFPLTATESPAISYSSNNTSVAQVDNGGKVTIKGAGQATITATPEGTDDYYYASYSYTINITNLDEYYNITVADMRITSGNASDVFNDEKVSFTPATVDNSNNILTLKGAVINSETEPVIVSNLQNLVIKLIGTGNRLECSGNKSVISSTNANGFLSITDDNSGAAASLILATEGGMSVISGFAGMACTLTAYETNSDFHPIKEMANVAYDTENKVLKANGKNLESVYYSNQPISYGLTVAGTTVTSSNASNIITSGENDGKVSFDPEKNTLTLKGATLNDNIISNLPELTIDVQGINSITTNGKPCITSTEEDYTPSLTIKSTGEPKGALTLRNTSSAESCGGVLTKLAVTIDSSIEMILPTQGTGCLTMDTTHVAQFGEDYHISIGGVRLTNINISEITKDGKISYNSPKRTLTLNGAKIVGGIEWKSSQDLLISLDGENSISNTEDAVIWTSGVVATPTLAFTKAEGASNCKLTLTTSSSSFYVIRGFNENYDGLYSISEYDDDSQTTTIVSSIFSGGDGTEENPFVINSKEDLSDFSAYMNSRKSINKEISSSYYILNQNIDCSGLTDYDPINGGDRPFVGTFDGNGKTISNLTYTASDLGYIGLFSTVRGGGTVKNLTLSNCNFTGGCYAAAIVGNLEGNISDCNVENCTIITGNAQTSIAGGIAGIIYGGTIERCTVSGSTIKAQPNWDDPETISGNNGAAYAGGIAGETNSNGKISSCEVENTQIFASHQNSFDKLYAAGIVGHCSEGNTISGNKVKGTTKASSEDKSTTSSGNACAATIIGSKGSATLSNNTYEYTVTTESKNYGDSEATIKSNYNHRGMGTAVDDDFDLFENKGAVLADYYQVTLPTPANGEIWLPDYYSPTKSNDDSRYIVGGQEAVVGVNPNSNYAVKTVTVTNTETNATISTRIDNEVIGDGIAAYIFTMPKADVTIEASFGIDISDEEHFTSATIADATYTGEAQIPTSVTLTEANPESSETTTVTLGSTDFTIAGYKLGDTTVESPINAGTYTVTITGAGDYTGTRNVSYTIKKASIQSSQITAPVAKENLVYNGEDQDLVTAGSAPTGATMKYSLEANATEGNWTATVPKGKNVGTYNIYYKVDGGSNYESVAAIETPITATISQAAISAVTLEKTQLSWTGEEQTVGVASVKAGDLDVPSSDYTVSGNKGKEPGTYTVTVTANNTEDNNFKGSATATFTIDGGYLLWVGSTLVSESNKDDILGDGEKGDDGDYTKVPSFMFNPEENTLLVINSDAGMAIESRLPKLAIHLTGDNILKKVFFNNQGNTANTGTLLFTCDSNFPGTASIENTKGESAITGFESIDYEFDLQPIAPVKAKYTNGQITDSLGIVADTLTVGTPLAPLTGDEPETLNPDDFTQTNPDGSTASIDLSGATVNNIYYTLPETTDGQGYDPENNTISIVETMTDDDVEQIAQKTMDKTTTVGSNEYAENFVGLTFIVQGGEGIIKIIQEVTEGYEFHLKIGDRPSITVGEGQTGIATIEVPYELTDATYCWLYLVKTVAGSRWINTRVGKRDRATGNLHGVSVQPKNVASSKSASKASGGNISKTANDAITGIVEINNDTPSSNSTVEKTNDRWYTIDGRRIDKPTQKGLYIRNRKKIVIK